PSTDAVVVMVAYQRPAWGFTNTMGMSKASGGMGKKMAPIKLRTNKFAGWSTRMNCSSQSLTSAGVTGGLPSSRRGRAREVGRGPAAVPGRKHTNRPADTEGRLALVRRGGFEPPHPAPEAGALSPEL